MTAVRLDAGAWSAVLALAIVLPQLTKAFDIDDTIFLLQAEHLLDDPLGPYSFALNWSSASKPALFNNFNPPLLGYYLAAVGPRFGFTETPLHLATGLFVLLFGWWTYRWACACGVRPGLATVLALGSPPLAASVNCMPDIPHVALGIGGLFYLRRAIEGSRPARGDLLFAGTLLALAVLMKYPALVFVVLAGVATWRYPQTWWVLLMPAAALALVVGWQIAVHGQTHLALSQRIKLFGFRDMVGLNVMMVGGLAPGACALAFAGRGWRFWAVAIVAGSAGLAAWFGGDTAGHPVVRLVHERHPVELVAFCVLGAAGVAAAALTVAIGNRLERFLGLWVLAGIVFAAWYPEFPAPRRLFCVVPPLAILVLRQCAHSRSTLTDAAVQPGTVGEVVRPESARLVAAWHLAVLQAGLAALVAAADCERANAYRSFVSSHGPMWSGRTVWALGHDGWQWYVERAGWKTFEAGRSVPRAGDLLVDPVLLVKQIVYLRPSDAGRFEVVGVPEGAVEPRRYGVVRPLEAVATKASGPAPLRTGYSAVGVNVHGYLLPYAFSADYPLAEFAVYEFE